MWGHKASSFFKNVRHLRNIRHRISKIGAFSVMASGFTYSQSSKNKEYNLKQPLNANEFTPSAMNDFYGDMSETEAVDHFEQLFEKEDGRECMSLIDVILDNVGDWNGKLVVDLGAGTGILMPHISKRIGDKGALIALDITPGFVKRLQTKAESFNNVQAGQNTPQSMCLPPQLKGKLDIVIMMAVYHHLDNPMAVLDEVQQYLAPGGQLLIIDFKKGHMHDGPHDHEHPSHSHGHGHGSHGHKHEHSHEHGHGNAHSEDSKNERSFGRTTFAGHTPDMTIKKACGDDHLEFVKQHIPFTPQQCADEVTQMGFCFDGFVEDTVFSDSFVALFHTPRYN